MDNKLGFLIIALGFILMSIYAREFKFSLILVAYSVIIYVHFFQPIPLKQRIENLDKEMKDLEIEVMEKGNKLEAERPKMLR